MEAADQRRKRPAIQIVIGAAVAGLLAGAAGAFGGSWAWARYAAHQREAASAAAASAALAESESPKGRQRQVVRAALNDPDSAQFRNERQSTKDPLAWCGEVNARNRMGGMVGFRRYAARVSSGPQDLHGGGLDEVYIDPGEGRGNAAEQATFEVSYVGYCGP